MKPSALGVVSTTPMRFFAALALAVLSVSAACVPRHRAAVPGARLSVGAESFADDGPFRIAFAGPKGETASPREVTIAFSRAMRPLAMIGDEPEPATATGAPPASVVRVHDGSVVEGSWRWLSERTAVFWPNGGFSAATAYRVTIAEGTRALDGSTLRDAPSFSFTSARPSLRAASYAFDEATEKHVVTIDFEQPVRPSEVSRVVRIEGRGAKGVTTAAFRVREAKPETRFELDVDRSIAALEDVAVVAGPSLLGVDGPLPSNREQRYRLDEVGPLRAQIVCGGGDRVDDADAPPRAASVPRGITRCSAENVDVALELSKDVSTKEVGHPTSSSASVDLLVEAPLTKLAVAIEMDREARPGAEIVARVRVSDGHGRPAPAQVTLWAVDEAVVLLESFRVPDLQAAFGYERGDDVRTLESRDVLLWEHIGMHSVKSPSMRSAACARGAGTHVTRGLFRPTAFFFPSLVTGPDAVATVKVKLPDNLTTWNVYAVAMTSGEGFGAAESFFRTNKPLMARPQLPRFLRVGDHVEATVMVDSMSKAPLDVKVSMRTAGALAGSGGASSVSETSIVLPAEGHVPVRFPLDARAIGHGVVTFRVEAPRAKLADEVTTEEEIAAASVLETVVISGETRTRLDEPLGDLSRARSDVGGLDFRLATSPLVGLAASLEGLVEYPYGCTEQLTSRLVPLVRLRGMARELGVALPPDVDASVRASIASLLSHQRSDGGFGFWPASKISEAWLTIAALQALQSSRAAGYVVPAEPVDRATEYLANAKGLDAASRALLEDLFAGEGHPREKELRALAALGGEGEGMPLFAGALVAHALAKVDRALALRVLGVVASHATVSGATATMADEATTSWRATLSSQARTTAMVLRAFVAVDPSDPRVTKLVRGLLGLRRDGRWATTQDNAWALIALDDARALYTPPAGASATSARLWLDGEEIAKASFTTASPAFTANVPMARLVAATGGTLSFTAEGGPLFFEGALRYARREPSRTPVEHGIHVAKTMRVLRRNAAAIATTDFRVGDYVEVDVLLASPVARDLVVLDDPLPAGFEAVNQTYANRDAAMIRPDVSHAVTHRELRDDRVVTFFDTLPSGEHHTSYVLRVTSGGHFVSPPAKAECMYAPDVFGRTGASVIDAKP